MEQHLFVFKKKQEFEFKLMGCLLVMVKAELFRSAPFLYGDFMAPTNDEVASAKRTQLWALFSEPALVRPLTLPLFSCRGRW
jgi:hypothetical protein